MPAVKAASHHLRRSSAAGVVALLAAGGAAADGAPDTSAWKCEQCPFVEGYGGDAEIGALYAHGANFSYGRYTGIDRSTTYADVAAAGQYRSADGTNASFDLEDLGLASRAGTASIGREGRFDVKVDYDDIPTRLYDTGATPFLGAGGGNLTLPAGWVAAGSTAGMSALAATLAPVNIEYDRRTASLLGSYVASSAWTLHAAFRHEEKDGTGLMSGSFLTQAAQLPQPIDYVTDTVEAGAAWADHRASLHLTYTGSWFKNDIDSLTFTNPYLPLVAGSTQGRLALPPDNNLQQFALAGNLPLNFLATSFSYAASVGSLKQDEGFLPFSTLPGATIPTPSALDGDVHLSHYALALASHPLPKLSVRGDATYDGRDDHTTPLTLAYVVTDTFPGGSALITPRYSEDRTRLEGSADYTLVRWVRVGVGGKYLDTHYGPDQLVADTRDTESWVRATLDPLAGLTFTLKGGNASRKTSGFIASALPLAENPLVWAYDYAPRDREFFTLTGSWQATATLTWSVEGFFANDDYRLSQLGLQSVHERRASTTITWTPRETLSAYIDGGYQRLDMLQDGFTGAFTAPWQAGDSEHFWNLGAGGQWAVAARWTLALDYLHAPSYGDFNTQVGGLAEPFPQNWSRLDSVRLDLRYQWTRAAQLHLRFIHEKYDSSDWALGDVGPGTVPNLLALGVLPWAHDVNLVALTFRYQFGAAASAPPP
jgi:MtrB/PioB family decaheme-associated outer membrane protein